MQIESTICECYKSAFYSLSQIPIQPIQPDATASKMRRASFTPAFKLSVDEPLIVVDETDELDVPAGASASGISGTHHSLAAGSSGGTAAGGAPSAAKRNDSSSDDAESPTNPYLLSPFRDARETRKHSLPNIQITDGIKASQVRRLSDGGENAPTAQEAAFLAQLSQVTTGGGADGGPSGMGSMVGGAGGLMVGGGGAGGCRRHSIVTISRVPPILFGRNRRESFAAFASGEW